MDFNLDEAQREVVDLAREVLRREHDPDTTWKALARAGLLTLAVPGDLGGAGLGVLECALVLTEVGRCVKDVPALETVAFGVLPVARNGTEAQRRELLGPVGDGAVLTAALHEPSAPLPSAPRTTARPDGTGWALSGTLTGVREAGQAHRVLVPASLADGGTGVLLVDPAAAGVSLTPTPGSAGAGRPEYTLRLDGAPGELLGDDTTGRVLHDLHRLALAGACAVGDGVLAGALELTAEHLRTREQFGRPLATFQAVAQQVADVYLASRTVHLATLAACWRLDPADVRIAAYWLAEHAPPALHTCHHLHGGIGVDQDYPLHRHYSWTKDLARFVGGVEHRLEAMACTSN
ncbi:acyl-CoA dehydrogenase family protein [Pseudonocardia acaciae]|uniref:acyl-CoA dehydrogenase family protein n=1 Tax=Pseudonocardia acaciae TaxID=551276 RepID=UPI00048FCEDC|nr:acyl-CoA dehydrogenase family protein [Pseudonocardia acaciae]